MTLEIGGGVGGLEDVSKQLEPSKKEKPKTPQNINEKVRERDKITNNTKAHPTFSTIVGGSAGFCIGFPGGFLIESMDQLAINPEFAALGGGIVGAGLGLSYSLLSKDRKQKNDINEELENWYFATQEDSKVGPVSNLEESEDAIYLDFRDPSQNFLSQYNEENGVIQSQEEDLVQYGKGPEVVSEFYDGLVSESEEELYNLVHMEAEGDLVEYDMHVCKGEEVIARIKGLIDEDKIGNNDLYNLSERDTRTSSTSGFKEASGLSS